MDSQSARSPQTHGSANELRRDPWMVLAGGMAAVAVILLGCVLYLAYQVNLMQVQVGRMQGQLDAVLGQGGAASASAPDTAGLSAVGPQATSGGQLHAQAPDTEQPGASAAEAQEDASEAQSPSEPAEGMAAAGPLTKGRVLVVQPRQKTILLSIGANQGVTRGMRYTIWRNGLYVGEVSVRDPFTDMCLCEIDSVAGPGIHVGDIAREVTVEREALVPKHPAAAFRPTHHFQSITVQGGRP